MKQRTKLLWLLALVALLGSAALWLFTLQGKSQALTPVKAHATADIESIALTQKGGRFTVTRRGDSFTTTNFEGVDIAVNTADCTALFEAGANVSYREIISDTLDNKGEFGLDTPAVTATVALTDGGTYTIYVGNKYPSGSGVYFYLSDSDKVYGTADTAAFAPFSAGEDTFFERVLFPETKGSTLEQLSAVSWVRGGVSHSVLGTQKNGETLFTFQKPLKMALEPDTAKELFSPLLQLSALSIYKPRLTAGEKENLGFTGDKVTYTIDGNAHSFAVGKKTAAGYYVLAPNGVCYMVPGSSLQFFEHQFT